MASPSPLNAGLAALKAQNYPEAIALLATVPPGPDHDRAQIGLVMAYGNSQRYPEAIALCQQLCTNPNAKTRTWAEQALAKLGRKSEGGGKSEVGTLNAERGETHKSGLEEPAQPTELPTSSTSAFSVQRSDFPPPSAFSVPRSDFLPPFPFLAALIFLLVSSVLRWPGLPGWLVVHHFGVTLGLGTLLTGVAWWQREALAAKLGPLSLRTLEAWTAIALAWWVPASVSWTLTQLNLGLNLGLRWIPRIPWVPQVPVPNLAQGWPLAVLALVALPWAIDAVLRWGYGSQVLSTEALKQQYPAAIDLLRAYFRRQKQVNLPQLRLLPLAAPVVFSYGHLPRNARLVISQGFLDQLDEATIVTLLAQQLALIETRGLVVMPWLLLLLHLPYGCYWLLSRWGDTLMAKLKGPGDAGLKLLWRLGIGLCALSSVVSYGCFRLWRWPLLWLSRHRITQGDRTLLASLGPAGGDRYRTALRTLAPALTQSLRQHQQTPALLEAFEPLLPLNVSTALTIAPHPPAPSPVLAKGGIVPLTTSPWLTLNTTHPPIHPSTPKSPTQRPKTLPFRLPPSAFRLSLQAAPYLGPLWGLLAGYLLWTFGGLASLLGIWPLDWMFGDPELLWGCVPLGIALGLVLRTNRFFPERRSPQATPQEALTTLLSDPQALPLDAPTVEIQGKLLGRSGMSNWLGQDLLLDSEAGLFRLHWCSPLGPLGNLWPKFLRPSFLLQREVTVKGWLRRGATLWLDVEQLRTQRGKSAQRGHAIWSAVMAAGFGLWGAWMLATAGQ